MSLGVCREHAGKIDMEFINKSVMKELFKVKVLDTGKVHYAIEVGTFSHVSLDD